MEVEGFSLPVVEATCRYLAPARYEDLLSVGVEVPAVSRVTLTFRYQVTREGESELLCTGSTIHACLGRSGRPARLPDWVAALVSPSTA
jgi:acyl-CoA thioester hydrolase